MTCSHLEYSLSTCCIWAVILSSSFVLNLYLLVPHSITKLQRSDVRQIKWRIFSVTCTFTAAISIYPFFFCKGRIMYGDLLHDVLGISYFDWSSLLPLLHVMILYSGSFMTAILRYNFVYTSKFQCSKRKLDSSRCSYIISQCKNGIKIPFSNFWESCRNFFVAPLAEEIIFRSCMITPFVHNKQLSVAQICWTVPLFFGVAHAHHAWTKLKNGAPLKAVLFGTLFQLMYTTLFGAYASFCFLRTRSLFAVVISHSFCNFMGLPDFSLLIPSRNGIVDEQMGRVVKNSRIISALVYLMGIYFFYKRFDIFDLHGKNIPI